VAQAMKKQPTSTPDPKTHQDPNQERIEYLLTNIRPKPSSRFYYQQGSQPWATQNRPSMLNWVRLQRVPSIIIFVLVIVSVLCFASPSLDALANRLARFFIPTPNNLISVQFPSTDISDPETHFSKSIPEAVALAGFSVKIPSVLPDEYTFAGAEYNQERQAVILNYESTQGFILRITQRPAGVEYQSISIDATVETVQIGLVMGEYVVGGWKASQIEDPSSTATITLEATWDPDANIRFLRWEENDLIFEIISIGHIQDSNLYLDKIDLIAIAENMR
jgi:hypothetical protein